MDTPSIVGVRNQKVIPEQKRKRFSLTKGIVILFLSVLVITQVYPLIWLVLYSFKRMRRFYLEASSHFHTHRNGSTSAMPLQVGDTSAT